MDDHRLTKLFIVRDQLALSEADRKYGAYCRRVALNITGDPRDAEECFSDALLSAWNSIPPAEPESLGAYLARLTRNAALDKLEKRRAAKRGGGAAELALSELGEVSSSIGDPAEESDRRELIRALSDFVNSLPKSKRSIFTARYLRFEDMRTIAERTGRKEGNIRVALCRMRSELKDYLMKRGFIL